MALLPVKSGDIAATPLHEMQRGLLCVFAFVQGFSDNHYAMLESSRRCLLEATSSGVDYDQIAFHEGELAPDAHPRLSSIM